MPHPAVRRFVLRLLLVWICATGTARGDEAALPPAVLTLAGGQSVEGVFRPSASADVVVWQGTAFTQPFEFAAGQVASVRYPPRVPIGRAKGEFAFELTTGDVLTGRLESWSQDGVNVATERFGTVRLRRAAIRRMSRVDDNPSLVYSGLSGLAGWTMGSVRTAPLVPPKSGVPTPAVPLWREEGSHVSTNAELATLTGDFGIPERAAIEFELSWGKSPDFVLALAVDPMGKPEHPGDGWRLEVWDKTLAVVRETADAADVDVVQPLTGGAGRIRLTAFLDQPAGRMDLFLPDGTAAGKVAVPVRQANDAKGGRGVWLVNRRGDVTLERLRIVRWNGGLPSARAAGESRFELVDGTVVTGTLAGFDSAGRRFVVRTSEGETGVEVKSLVAADLATEHAGDSPPAAVVLHDGSRVSGRIDSIGGDGLVVACPEIAEPLRIPYRELRAWTVLEKTSDDVKEKLPGRKGRIELGEHRLAGRLIPATRTPEECGLAWHPEGSRTGSPLRPGVSGRIVYREITSAAPAASQPQQTEAPVVNGLLAGLGFRNPKKPAATLEPVKKPALHLRSGDNIPCTVVSMDEEGVVVSSAVASPRKVPHAMIKAAELVQGAKPPSVREAKRQRLLTLPRLQKASPPTHLLVSRNGDFLRCRIVAMDEQRVRVEVHLAEMDIPRGRIAQIVWFHPDELRTDDKPPAAADEAAAVAEVPGAAPAASLAQALWRDGKRVTFSPESFDGTELAGASDVLGTVRFKIDDFDQLLLGAQIEAAASKLAWQQWKLRPAVEPLVAQDLGDGPGVAGPESPLVGKAAPEIELELLDGRTFKLSDEKGKVVVLDFWATWCGPCMKTMPLVEEALKAFDPAKVRLVAVNVEEPAGQVRSTLERQKLDVEVALDVDGIAARRYEATAIPQLVVIDRSGTVARLYVGGGPQMVERLKAALTELTADPAR